MPDPILTLRIETTQQFLDLEFADALSDQLNVKADDPHLAYGTLTTGTAGDDIGAVLCDAVNLASGVYRGRAVVSSSEAAVDFDFQHRNAGDTANIASVRFDQQAGVYHTTFDFTCRVLLNESLRLILQTNIGNGETVFATIVMDRVSL